MLSLAEGVIIALLVAIVGGLVCLAWWVVPRVRATRAVATGTQDALTAAQASTTLAQQQAAAAQAAVGKMFADLQELRDAVSSLRVELDAERAYTRALRGAFEAALAPEPAEVRTRILDRVQWPGAPPPRHKRGTGPLDPGPALAGTLPPGAQRELVELLILAPGLRDSRHARDQLLHDLPPAFRTRCDRSDTPREDLALIIDCAVAWGATPGQPPVFVQVLDNAASILGPSSAGQALAAWRERTGMRTAA